MDEIKVDLGDRTLRVRIISYVPWTPPRICGRPEDCYPAEGGDIEWEVLDGLGRPAPHIEAKLTRADRLEIDDAVVRHFENQW